MINVYLSGNEIHDRVLKAFFEGIDEDKILISNWEYRPSEVAVVFGIHKKRIKVSWPRGEIIAQQRSKNLDVIVLETGYINRGDGEQHHYAAGWNGLNGRADFRNKEMPDDRAELLREANLLRVLNWRDQGDRIILCGQVPWDASVDHLVFEDWLYKTAKALLKLTDRPVVFRPHPLAKIAPLQGCDYSAGGPLWEDLIDAHAVVTLNSNSGVDALIEGIPVFAFDEGSMVWDVCNRVLKDIEDPKKPERKQWLNDLCYAQWTLKEMKEGKAWKHLSRSQNRT